MEDQVFGELFDEDLAYAIVSPKVGRYLREYEVGDFVSAFRCKGAFERLFASGLGDAVLHQPVPVLCYV